MSKKEFFNMNMNFIRKLPIPQELKKQFSLSDELIAVKAARDAEIQKEKIATSIPAESAASE